MSKMPDFDANTLKAFGITRDKKVTWGTIKPGRRYIITFHDNAVPEIGTLIGFTNASKEAIRFSVEHPPPWHTAAPVITTIWKDRVYAIHEPPSFEKKLALVNTTANLPPEMLGEIMKFERPSFKGGPYPGTERQKAATKAAIAKTRAEVPGEEELAVGRGRRKTRRRARKTTRRR